MSSFKYFILFLSSAGTKARSEGRNSTLSDVKHPAPCSWPPGMMCVPGVARNLQILRWHCR